MSFKIRTEVKAGIIVLITIGALIWGFYFLKGKDIFKNEDLYHAVYKRVDGLSESSLVLINGLKIGLVRKVDFISETDRNIIVTFAVPRDYKIQKNSVAEIFSLDLMGSKGIRINITSDSLFYKPGDTLISLIERDLKEQVSAQVLPLKSKAEDLLKSMDSVMVVIQYIFNESTRDNLSKTFASIKKTIENLEHSSVALDTLMQNEKGKLSRIFSNVESITHNLKANNDQLTNVINNFSNISDSLAKSNIKSTIYNANQALTDANLILNKIKSGEGTIGMLLNNDSLYNNLERSSLNLDKLLKDIRENPKRYLHFSVFDFGKTVIVDEDGNKVKKNKKSDESSSINSNDKVYFSVQIKSSKNKIINKNKELSGVDSYQEHFISGWYKYTHGSFSSYQDVQIHYQSLKNQFPDCFIVAFKGNSQISVSEAQKENGI